MTTLVLYSLAVWRLSSLISREDGPGRVFAHVRRAAGTEREGEISSLADGIQCMWCVSVWVAGALFGLSRLSRGFSVYLVWTLALSAGALVIEAFHRSSEPDPP